LRTFGFWSWAANLTWSIRLLTASALDARGGLRRRTLTIFSRPVVPSLAARYSWPMPTFSTSSRRTNFPNFSLLAIKRAFS
jgi:hypothetical protein